MIFTTVKKRVEKEELFPNDAVMTLVDNKFSLNKKAMELFGFPLNTSNTSKIANGYDENNNILLTNMDTKDMYTNNVTAKNDFSSQLLSKRLSKQFKLNTDLDIHFRLNVACGDGTYNFVSLELINSVNIPMQYTNGPAVDLSNNLYEYPFIEPLEEELTAIETAYADEIVQISEVIEESPLVCAEVVEKPYEQTDIKVMDGTEIPVGIVNRVINTESW